jgi:hypothetical protein
MREGGRVKPMEPSTFFADGLSSRRPVPGTVARDPLQDGTSSERGAGHAQEKHSHEHHAAESQELPMPLTRGLLTRGQLQYNIHCAVCHGYTGYGDGMIVQRGFTPPPSFHIDRLRSAPPSHYVDVIRNGYGAMYSYAERVAPDDRWAITAYIKALQLSQHAPAEMLPPNELSKATAPPPTRPNP